MAVPPVVTFASSVQPPTQTDVIVIGGGPAGLAAAIAARAKGLGVVVADCSRPPIEKACGEGLMPDGLIALSRLGVTVGSEDSFPFRGIRFLGAGASVCASFPSGYGLGVRRTTLHQLLIDRAAESGAVLSWGTRVDGIGAEGVVLDGCLVRGRWVIGADGQKSCVRRWAGLEGYRHYRRRFGFRRHYRVAPWTDCMEIYWGAGCQFYVTPVSPREVCIVLISRDPHLRIDEALTAFPELTRRLECATSASTEQGAISTSCSLKSVARGNVALIGDASGSVDAITGEGLCLSFQQAVALAEALASGDLRLYQAEHRGILSRPTFMAEMMLSLDRLPRLRRRTLRTLVSRPAIFANLLAMHVGALSPVDFFWNGVVPLGWRLLTARGV